MSSFEAIRARITALNLSPQGERWVTQALYPPGEHARCAIPTTTHYPTLRMDFRPTTVVGRPSSMPSGNWDLLIFSPPSDATALVVVAAPAGTNFESGSAPAYHEQRLVQAIPNLLPAGVSYQTFTRDASGAVTAGSLTGVPNPLRHMGFRITSKSYTAHMTASDLYNSGSVTTSQFDTRYEPGVGFVVLGGVRALVPCLCTVPLDEDEITSTSPYSVVSEAKDGIFVPHRIMGPSFGFVRPFYALDRKSMPIAATETTISAWGSNPPLIGAVPLIISDSNTAAQPWWLPLVYSVPGRPEDSGFDNVTTGVSIFRGLNFEATITISVHIGFEFLTQTESPFRTLVTDPDEPDTRALVSYYEIAQRMPHAYPASYNALGLVLPAVAQAVRSIVPHLPKLLPLASALLPEVGKLFKQDVKTEVKRIEKRQRPPRQPERSAQPPPRGASGWALAGRKQDRLPALKSKTKNKTPKRRKG